MELRNHLNGVQGVAGSNPAVPITVNALTRKELSNGRRMRQCLLLFRLCASCVRTS